MDNWRVADVMDLILHYLDANGAREVAGVIGPVGKEVEGGFEAKVAFRLDYL